MTQIKLTINGVPQTFEVPANRLLLDLLREQGSHSVKHGCETGDCGSCTVLLEGRPTPSCLVLAASTDGQAVQTLEGLGQPDDLHPLQEAFVDWGGIQCGFCTPGMIIAAQALLSENPQPTEPDVRDALEGVLCRCTGYVKPVQAILAAAEKMRATP